MYRIALGKRAGQKVLTIPGAPPAEGKVKKQALCANVDGFSLHAAVRCAARERKKLERRCRYITRPALAHERVRCNELGQVVPKPGQASAPQAPADLGEAQRLRPAHIGWAKLLKRVFNKRQLRVALQGLESATKPNQTNAKSIASVNGAALTAKEAVFGSRLGETPGESVFKMPILLTHDILKVTIELESAMNYVAGKYMNLTRPNVPRARHHFFADAPQRGGRRQVLFFIRRVPEGAFTEAPFAENLTEQTLDVEGPMGASTCVLATRPCYALLEAVGLRPSLACFKMRKAICAARPPGSMLALND